MHGYGIMTFPDNSKYEGYWDSGFYQGQGRFESSEGDIYVGSWNKGHVCTLFNAPFEERVTIFVNSDVIFFFFLVSRVPRKKVSEFSKRRNSDMKVTGKTTTNMVLALVLGRTVKVTLAGGKRIRYVTKALGHVRWLRRIPACGCTCELTFFKKISLAAMSTGRVFFRSLNRFFLLAWFECCTNLVPRDMDVVSCATKMVIDSLDCGKTTRYYSAKKLSARKKKLPAVCFFRRSFFFLVPRGGLQIVRIARSLLLWRMEQRRAKGWRNFRLSLTLPSFSVFEESQSTRKFHNK